MVAASPRLTQGLGCKAALSNGSQWLIHVRYVDGQDAKDKSTHHHLGFTVSGRSAA